MANCRACGGILGLDCFNEADCLEISRSEQYSNDFNIGDYEHYISILIYKLKQSGLSIPNSFSAEPPLIMKIPYGCNFDPMVCDDLPF